MPDQLTKIAALIQAASSLYRSSGKATGMAG
jgi:hypothetical protein